MQNIAIARHASKFGWQKAYSESVQVNGSFFLNISKQSKDIVTNHQNCKIMDVEQLLARTNPKK